MYDPAAPGVDTSALDIQNSSEPNVVVVDADESKKPVETTHPSQPEQSSKKYNKTSRHYLFVELVIVEEKEVLTAKEVSKFLDKKLKSEKWEKADTWVEKTRVFVKSGLVRVKKKNPSLVG